MSSPLPSPFAGTEIVILGARRTPLGAFLGVLESVPAFRLGAAAIRGALSAAAVDPQAVTDVLMGNVLQAGQGQAPARQAAIAAGLPESVRTVTINKVCGSGLQAVMQGAHSLACGMSEVVVAGGMENMSAAPYLASKARKGYRLGHQTLTDSILTDGLWDSFQQLHMGACAEQCASRYRFTREDQDAYASESFRRANAAQQAGRFSAEIVPVEIPASKGASPSVALDEGPARVNYAKMPTLAPAFDPSGTITAANASSLNDGAAALVLTTAARAAALGVKPIGRIAGFGAHAQAPLWFTTAPLQAARSALAQAGWTTSEVDLWEVNEAFAVVPLAFARDLAIGYDRMNVNGGAIALGHPIGASGARILVTLLAALHQRGLRKGLAAICIGGGEGLAIAVELL
jgi:acetyl-CoA C-acetyltransferase